MGDTSRKRVRMGVSWALPHRKQNDGAEENAADKGQEKKKRYRAPASVLKQTCPEVDANVPLHRRKTDDELIQLASANPKSSVNGPIAYRRHVEAPYA